MGLALLQQKLNVSAKTRSNLFNWRGQFTPEFVDYLVGHFARSGEFVVDPFSGSGTVLQTAVRHNLRASGFEINPSAYAMSKFFTFANLCKEDRQGLLDQLGSKLKPRLASLNGEMVFVAHEEYRTAYSKLLNFGVNVLPSLSKSERTLLLNCLFLSERDKKMTLRDSIQKSFEYISKALLDLPASANPIEAILGDARETGARYPEVVDLILTSPPYINVFNYHQNYRAFVELFNFDLLVVANSEFGSNRKNRGNRFRTVIQYCLDMEDALHSFWNALKPGAFFIIVLGKQSNVRSIPFYNGRIVMDIVDSIGGFSKTDVLQREFLNKFGNTIKEDILFYQKTNDSPLTNRSREVALKHLEMNIKNVNDDVLSDLKEAISNIAVIQPSPYFDLKRVIKNAENAS